MLPWPATLLPPRTSHSVTKMILWQSILLRAVMFNSQVLATYCEPTSTLKVPYLCVHFEILIHDHTTIYYWPLEALPRGGQAEENVRSQLISWVSVTIRAFKFQSTNKYKSIGTSLTYLRTLIFYTNVCADKTRKAIQKSTIQTIQGKQIYIEM